MRGSPVNWVVGGTDVVVAVTVSVGVGVGVLVGVTDGVSVVPAGTVGSGGKVGNGGNVGNGGKVGIFVGRLEQDNARLRRQGVIDELMGRDEDSSRFDAPDAKLKGDKFEIVGTRTDQFDRAQAKSNMEDMVALHPDLACAVGLFAYNPPACLEGLKRLDKLGKIQVVAFDEQDATLQAIKDGHCHGTVVQNPYMYGHESVRILAGMHRGATRGMPTGKFLDIPARKIVKSNVDEFWADLRDKTAKK